MGTEIPFETVLAEHLQNPKFRAGWERDAVARAVALWLIEYRNAHSLSIEQLAERAGMDPEAVLDLEAEDVDPTLTTLLELSRALGTPIVLRVERGLPGENVETIVIGAPAEQAA
jgi:transcriptional regulator with XRE-family HTH domain